MIVDAVKNARAHRNVPAGKAVNANTNTKMKRYWHEYIPIRFSWKAIRGFPKWANHSAELFRDLVVKWAECTQTL